MTNSDANGPDMNSNTDNAGADSSGAEDPGGNGGMNDGRPAPTASGSVVIPSSTANPAAGKQLEVWLPPSQKELAKQAAAWRDASLTSVVNLGLEEAAGVGGPVPLPTIHRELLNLSAKIQKLSKAPQDNRQMAELRRFHIQLSVCEERVRDQRQARRQLWKKATEETATVAIRARLCSKESARLRRKSEQTGTSPASLLHQGLLRALGRQSEMRELRSCLGQWARRAKCLSGKSPPGGESKPWIWEGAAEVAREIDRTFRGRLSC